MDNENSNDPVIILVMFIILGGIAAWGFATDWTFSGLLPKEGAKCTPEEDDKDENAKSYVYDDDENCIIKTCKEDWEPDESNTACISSISGTSCEFEGTKIDKGVYEWSSTNACEISSCTGNFKLNSAKTACDDCETGFTLTDGSCVANPSSSPAAQVHSKGCTDTTSDCVVTVSTDTAGPASFAHPSGYNLVMQGDGNLVIYKDGNPTWATATNGRGANKYVMRGDGNLVLYKNSEAIWDSSGDYSHSMNPTRNYSLDSSKAPYGLYMNRYGELTIKDKDKNIVWRNMNNYTRVNGKIITPGLHQNTFLETLPYDVEDGLNIQGAVNEHKNERLVEGATNIFKYNLTGHPFYPDIDKLPYECRRWCDQNPKCVGVVYDRNAGFAGRCILSTLVVNKTVNNLTYAQAQHGYNYYGKTWSDGHPYQTALDRINLENRA